MKRLFYFLIVLSCTLWSCGGDDKGVDNPNNPDNPDNPTNITLDISTTDLTFKASGGQKEFTIYCNSDWTITSNSTWCKTDVNNGNGDKTITVTADPYSETEDQNTNLTIKAGDKTQVLTVTQKHGDAIILTKDKFDIPQEGDNITIEVKSNIKYQVSIPYKFQSWIKEAVKSKAVTTKNFSFTISANEDFDKREGYIVFSGNSLKDTVYVYQAQKNQLILTEDIYNIPAEGKDITVELKTNVDYEVAIPNDAKSWISQVTTKAIRTDQLKFHIEANNESNNRSTKVVIKDENSHLSDTVYISQTPEGTYAGNVTLTTIEEVKAFQKAGYKKVNGNLTIKGNEITTLVQLNNQLEEITGNFTTDYYCKLTNCDGLYGLKKVGGNLNISAESLEGLNHLEVIEGDIETNTANTNGLESLKEIKGNAMIGSKSFKGLKSLTKIGKNFIPTGYYTFYYLFYNSFEGLENLREIGGDLDIKINNNTQFQDNFQTFKGLQNLSRIGGSFKFKTMVGSNNLKDFDGLNSLVEIGSNFEIYALSNGANTLKQLTSFNGLNNLKRIGENFIVKCEYYAGTNEQFLNELTSFNGLENLNEIGGSLELNITSSNTLNSLTSFEGLSGLTEIKGSLLINVSSSSLNSLKSFKGLTALNKITGDFKIICEYAKNSIGYGLSSLESFEGIEKLEYIGGNLDITYLGQQRKTINSLIGFHGLRRISGNLNLNNIYNMKNISALTNTEINGNITIEDCRYLYDFCTFQTTLLNNQGTFLIKNCGYNPTKYQILNGECSKQPE